MNIFRSVELTAPLERMTASILDRADGFGFLADGRIWSLAELHADEDDLKFVSAWLSSVGGTQASAMIRPWPSLEIGSRRIGTSAAFGLIFLFAASEVARRYAVEGQVWATVCRKIPWDRAAARVFFVQGQPCSELRDAIEISAVRFNLRHVFGLEGGMAWMSTTYLQFGFTQRGFQNVLPEWLAGWHRPLAIQRLLFGHMRSVTFCTLWSSLVEWRRGGRPLALARQSITASPWVLPEWTNDLLAVAREKLHLADNPATYAEAQIPETPWCSEPHLCWDGIGEPRFKVEVDLEAVPSDASGFRIMVGGIAKAQLTRQADGRLSSLPAGPILLPSEAPVTELSVVDTRGEGVLTRALTLWDNSEDVQIFDITSGERVRDPWEDRLSPTRGCLLLLADDLVVESAATIVWHALAGSRRKLWRIDGQLSNIRVLLDGDELWRPLLHERPSEPRWLAGLNLHTQAGNGGFLSIRLTHGSSTTVRAARLGTTALQIDHRQPGSTQFAPTALNITGARSRMRLFATVVRNGGLERGWVEGRLEYSGICQLLPSGWVACNPMTCLTARDAASHLFRILTQYDGDPNRPWILLEGESQRSIATEDPSSIQSLSGLGAPLAIRRGIFHGPEPQTIIGKVINPGVFHRSRLVVDDGCAHLPLCSDLDLSSNHRVFAWTSDGLLREIASESVACRDQSLELNSIPPETISIALAYDGVRLGAVWRDDWSTALATLHDETTGGLAAALLRWLQLPLLDSASLRNVRNFAAQNSTSALGAWLAQRHLPDFLVPPPNTEGWFTAVRALFRNVREFPTANLILEDALVENTHGDLLRELLPQSAWLLGRCDPIVLGRVLRAWLTTRNASANDRRALAALLKNEFADLPANAAAHFLGPRCDKLLTECAQVLQADEGFVERLVSIAVGIFRDGAVPDNFNKYNLLLAMNRDAFRRLVAIRILDLL